MLFKSVIKKHQESFVADDEPRDYIDAFLVEHDGVLTEDKVEDLTANMTDMFLAGSETTSKTMSWVVLFMATHPDVQEKVKIIGIWQRFKL